MKAAKSKQEQQRLLGQHVSGQSNGQTPLSLPAHSLTYTQVANQLKGNIRDGLTRAEAEQRLALYGSNELASAGSVQPAKIMVRQVANAMTIVLILSMVVSFAIRSYIEAVVIGAVILLNIVIGFIQEYKAAKTMDSLRSLSSPTALTVRNGAASTIATVTVVPGDLIELKTGDTIPADIRLIQAVNFETDEALLTGESLPVRKDAEVVLDTDLGPGDRINVAYSSSTVTKGRAIGIVFATGMFTEIGSIASALNKKPSKRRPVKKRPDGTAPAHRYVQAYALTFSDALGRFLGVNVGTPLQMKLSRLAILLFGLALLCALIVMAANKFVNRREVIIYAVATGVSMLPASLVVLLTITMAAGTKCMVARNVIVRNLRSLEALGAVTDICSDKTGTLTQGKMVAKKVWIPGSGTYSVGTTNEPFNPTDGELSFNDKSPDNIHFTGLDEKSDGAIKGSKDQLLKDNLPLEAFLNVASLANLSHVHKNEQGNWVARGDPTEIAMLVFASRFGLNRADLLCDDAADNPDGDDQVKPTRNSQGNGCDTTYNPLVKRDWRVIAEFPFDSSIKKMSVLCEVVSTGKRYLFSKGAVERIIEASVEIVCGTAPGRRSSNGGNISAASDNRNVDEFTHMKTERITQEHRSEILRNMDALSNLGLRVLALAYRRWGDTDGDAGCDVEEKIAQNIADTDRSDVERDLTFLGLIAIYDPPRSESAPSVAQCHRAGISVHMLTGDHPGTAVAIAKDVGILPAYLNKLDRRIREYLIMTAAQFDKLSDEEIDQLPSLPLVVARCAPSTKVRIIEALHRRKKFCAMTGDGVNDSPSLKRSDVGIAMGMTGSDVAKDASDIVLTDDNFASITNAVEEGRRMFDNIKRFVLHLLAENIAQACVLIVGLAFKDSRGFSVFPISPVEALWIIMVTSGMPDMGLGFEHAVPEIMSRPPHDLRRGIFTIEVMIDMLIYGLWISALCLGSFVIVAYGFGNGDLGYDCNTNYRDPATRVAVCDLAFRARATTFACLTSNALLLAWQMMDFRRSFFRMHPHSGKSQAFQWIRDIWSNQFLFWSIVFGFVTLVPVIYIPVLNTVVFKHAPLTWEWAVVFIETGAFMLGVEIWLFFKRVYLRHRRRHNVVPSLKEGANTTETSAKTPLHQAIHDPTVDHETDHDIEASGHPTSFAAWHAHQSKVYGIPPGSIPSDACPPPSAFK